MARRLNPGGGDTNPLDGGPGDTPPGPKGGGSTNPPGRDPQPRTLAETGRPIPLLYGTHKVPLLLLEKSDTLVASPDAWQIGAYYTVGDHVAFGGNAYRCTQSGLSAPRWRATHAYLNGEYVASLGNYAAGSAGFLQCLGGGTTASLEPNFPGVGNTVTDGTCLWLGVATLGPSGTGTTTEPGGGPVWEYKQQLPMTITYQAFAAALCEGEIAGAKSGGSVWWDKERFGSVTSVIVGRGLQLWTGPDTLDQSIGASWHNSGYQHTALVAPATFLPTVRVSTGTQGELPDIAVETSGQMFGATTPDVNPADIVNDLLTHGRRGCGWSSSRVDASITGTGAGDFRVYCDAAGFRFSMYIDTQRTALALLRDILDATNSDCVWSGGKLKIVPLGDQPIASPVYGSTGYVPANTSRYDLTPADFLEPLSWDRRADVDCFNSIPVEYTDRAQGYQRITVEDPEMVDAELRGPVRDRTLAAPVTFADGKPAVVLSRILAQRSLKVRNTYTFRLSWRFCLLEPTDIVTLSDPLLGLDKVAVRIVSVEENIEDDGRSSLTVIAEDYPAAVQAAKAYTPAAGTGYVPNEVSTTADIPKTIDGVQNSLAESVVGWKNLHPDSIRTDNYAEVTPPAWQVAHSYTAGDLVRASGNVYKCVLTGTSGSSAPSGTGRESDASTAWQYLFAGSSYPTAGAKVDSAGIALKVAPGNLQIGSLTIQHLLKSAGVISFAGTTNTASLSISEPDVNYVALVIPKDSTIGSPSNLDCWTVTGISRSTTSIDVTIRAGPGNATNCRYDVFILRAP